MNKEQKAELKIHLHYVQQARDEIKYAAERWNDAKDSAEAAIDVANDTRLEVNETLHENCKEGNTFLQNLYSYIEQSCPPQFEQEENDPVSNALSAIYLSIENSQEFAEYPEEIEEGDDFELLDRLDPEDYYAIDTVIDNLTKLQEIDLEPELSLQSLHTRCNNIDGRITQTKSDLTYTINIQRELESGISDIESLVETLKDTLQTHVTSASDRLSTLAQRLYKIETTMKRICDRLDMKCTNTIGE